MALRGWWPSAPLVTRSPHDRDGRALTSTDPLSRVTRTTYDRAGQLTQVTRPDSTTRSTGCDASGNVSSRTDGLGHVTTYGYDSTQLGNQALVKSLTADGSQIADWGRYTTQTFRSPSGPFQVHFYYNSTTGNAFYDLDYKAVYVGSGP